MFQNGPLSLTLKQLNKKREKQIFNVNKNPKPTQTESPNPCKASTHETISTKKPSIFQHKHKHRPKLPNHPTPFVPQTKEKFYNSFTFSQNILSKVMRKVFSFQTQYRSLDGKSNTNPPINSERTKLL